MDTAKQKSKWRISTVVLVALTLALTAGVAYAAYRVYVDIYLPSQQAQQHVEEIDPQYEAAMRAYEGVLQEYKDAFEQNASAQETADWPHVSQVYLRFMSGSARQWYYAEHDLNGDGIPELLIGGKLSFSSYDEHTFYDIWSYGGGGLIQVARGSIQQAYSLREGDVVMSYAQLVTDTYLSGFRFYTPTSDEFVDAAEGDGMGLPNFTEKEVLVIDPVNFGDEVGTYTHTSNGEVVEHGELADTRMFPEMVDDLLEKRPACTDIAWQMIISE